MATKKELIKIIKNSDNSEDWGDLNSMKKSELEQIAAYVEKLEEIEEEEVNYEFEEEMILGAPIDDEQTVIDPLPEPEEEKVLPRLYAYLEGVDQLNKLDEKYRSQAAIAEGLARENMYGEIDSISLITSEPIQIKSITGSAYFYRVKFEDDNLWRLSYVVFADNEKHEGLYTKELFVKRGEQFNPEFDDMNEIIADAVKEINLTGRDRVIQDNGYGYYDY